ncbi:ribonuclease HII [Halobacteriales archaeon QS_8_69_26]|nr:MAG: ribonuclease HII [Halobacteriales archaeon QS_8_69_26]
MFGVDEAGKGPALGSMFAAAVAVPEESVLPDDMGDSKGIAPARRRELADRLRADDRVRVGVAEVPTDRIDDPGTDMNGLTVAAQAEALGRVVREGESGMVDAGDVNADRFGRRVADRVSVDVTVRAEHGADESHPVVGAASVVAKVERDAHVAELAEEYGDVGSGYPSDPATREFIREYVRDHGDLPDCARTSWSTCEDALAAADQSALGDF